MKNLILLVILLFTGINYNFGQGSSNITKLNVTEFNSKAASGNYVIIDTRTKKEFDEGHISGAINIDYYSGSFILSIENYSSKPFLLYSRNESMNNLSLEKINTIAHAAVFVLDNGLVSWKREGKELVK